MEQNPIAPDAGTSNAGASNAGTSTAGTSNTGSSNTGTSNTGTTNAAPNSPAAARTTLARTTGAGMVGGVCAGLADYFDVDPVLVRAVFVAGAFMSGFSLVLYLVLWVALDDADRQAIDGPTDDAFPPSPSPDGAGVPYPADTDIR